MACVRRKARSNRRASGKALRMRRLRARDDDARLRARVEVARLRASGVPFRTEEIVNGPGGAQIVIDDPSGNPVELFQPGR